MKIKSFTPFVPANVEFEVEDKSHEIFVLVCLTPFTVIVPDADHYAVAKPHLEELTKILKEQLSLPVDFEADPVPDEVIKQARAAKSEVDERYGKVVASTGRAGE